MCLTALTTRTRLRAVEYGITNGTAPGLFSPAQTCTRAQIVTFLYRDLAAEWEDYET